MRSRFGEKSWENKRPNACFLNETASAKKGLGNDAIKDNIAAEVRP